MSFTVLKNIYHDARVVVFIKQHHPDIIVASQAHYQGRKNLLFCARAGKERESHSLARSLAARFAGHKWRACSQANACNISTTRNFQLFTKTNLFSF